ncbi:MAG TPA: hypothetical protein VJW23_17200 [Propionibacteriaceae bacterium]|nr:hypothetical protein [Propionibacteriaceae bacterium]
MIRRANEGYGGNTRWNGGGATSDPGVALRQRIVQTRHLMQLGKITAARDTFKRESNGQA